MMRTQRRLLAQYVTAFVLIMTAGCSEQDIVQAIPEHDTSSWGPQAAIAALGGAMARAFQSADVRENVIEEMRRSPMTEHKVQLHEILGAHNDILRRELAAALSVTEAELKRIIGLLPEMDFYLASRPQRREWTVDGADPYLAVSLDGEQFRLYDPTGNAIDFSREKAAEEVTFAIHPTEPTAYRMGRRSSYVPGPVIEDPADGVGGMVIEYKNANGEHMVFDLGFLNLSVAEVEAHLLSITGQNAAGSNGLATQSPPGDGYTYLTWFANERIADVPIGSAEIEFKAHKDANDIPEGFVEEYKFRWTDVDLGDRMVGTDLFPCRPSDPSNCVDAPGLRLLFPVDPEWTPGQGYPYAHGGVWETDSGADDFYGHGYWGISDSGEIIDYPWCGQFLDPCAFATLSF